MQQVQLQGQQGQLQWQLREMSLLDCLENEMLTTTLEKIREKSPCQEGWKKLLATLNKTKADSEPVSFIQILDSNGLNDALWCLRAEPENKSVQKKARLFAVFCARQHEHLLTDERSKNAINVAERFANGKASQEELESAAASAAAIESAWAASAAAWAARAAAIDAAIDAAMEAARAAAMAATWAARAARAAQRNEFTRLFGE
jgi:hypothetical protein